MTIKVQTFRLQSLEVQHRGQELYSGVPDHQAGPDSEQTLKFVQGNINSVNSSVVFLAPFAIGQPQKKGISPVPVNLNKVQSLKYVNNALCVDHLCSVTPVANVPNVASNLPVGTRLQNYWTKWVDLGANPTVVQILREGYHLPFRIRPKLARNPTVISCYVNPHRNSYLVEALYQLITKNAIEIVQNPNSLGFFNRLFLVPKPNKKWRPILDLRKLNLFLKVEKFKMETLETLRTSLQQGEWVTSIDFKDAYFHIPIHQRSRKYLRFHVQGQTYQFKALPFGLSTAPMEFTIIAKEVKLMAISKGIRLHQYLDDWLVRASSHHLCLQHTPKIGPDLSGAGLVSECREVRTRTLTGLRFCRLSIRPPVRLGPTYPGPVANPSGEDRDPTFTVGLSGPAIHVLDRPVNSHRKAGSSRSTAYEAHTVASQKQLEGTRISGENYPITQITTPPLKVVAGGRQCAPRATITPLKTCSANFYRRIKRRLGRLFKRTHCKRFLVSAGKQVAHKLSGTKSSLSSLKGVPGPLCKQYSASGHRQYNSGGLHEQRRRHEVRSTLCPAMENPDLVCQEASDTERPTHPGSAERGSRQTIQIRTDHSNGVVPPSAGIRSNMLQVAPASNRPLCHQIQQQATSLCVTLSRSPDLSSRCTQPTMGGSGSLCFRPNSHIGQGSREVAGLPVQQNHSDRPGAGQTCPGFGTW